MRKILFSLLTFIALVLVAACGSGNADKTINADSTTVEGTNPNVLVAYFSATGNTRKAAEEVAQATGGSLYEIIPEQAYTDKDLDYEDETSRTTIEKDDTSIRPAILSKVDIAPYSTIYLGFPIWWYRAPLIISTFLESHDFQGKKVVVFATSGSSTLDSSFDTLKKEFPNINFVKGAVLNSMTGDSFDAWLKSIKTK